MTDHRQGASKPGARDLVDRLERWLHYNLVFKPTLLLRGALLLLAVSHTVKAGKMTAFEFIRVVMKNGKATYVAQPGGVPPTEFVATSQTGDRIVFENPAHDFPKRVIYERSGPDRLTASIDGGAASRKRVEYAMSRERCE